MLITRISTIEERGSREHVYTGQVARASILDGAMKNILSNAKDLIFGGKVKSVLESTQTINDVQKVIIVAGKLIEPFRDASHIRVHAGCVIRVNQIHDMGGTLRVGSQACDGQARNLIGYDFGENVAFKNIAKNRDYPKKSYKPAENVVHLKPLRDH